MQNYDDQNFMKSVISVPEFDLIVYPITEADQGIVKVLDKGKPGSSPVFFVLAYERKLASVGDETSNYSRLISFKDGIAKIAITFKLYQGASNIGNYDFGDRLVEKEFDLDLRDLQTIPF